MIALQNIIGKKPPETRVEIAAGNCRDILKRPDDNNDNRALLVSTGPPHSPDGPDDDRSDERLNSNKVGTGAVGIPNDEYPRRRDDI